MTQMAQEELEDTQAGHKMPLVRYEIQLASGGTTVLYGLDADGAAAGGSYEVTSVRSGMVLNSAAVQLGEYGTVRELAESELYHWADAGNFSTIQYTRPIRLGGTRYAVHLRLDNGTVGMEHLVVYTDTGGGVARVDRLWRAIADIWTDHGSAAFDRAAACLVSEQTL